MLRSASLGLLLLLAAAPWTRPAASAPARTLTVHLDRQRQTIHHFGASDCWTCANTGTWPLAARERVADLLFSRSTGIGLTGWRTNLGAGMNRKSIPDPWRSGDSYEVAKGRYDWSRLAAQRWFLRAAKTRGVKHFTAFSLSPTARLTRNGLTNATDGLGTANWKDGAEGDYARYLADIVEHFERKAEPEDRVVFDRISPVNEPQWEWNQSSGHEGTRASNADLLRLYAALDGELRRRRLSARVLGPESGRPVGLVDIEAKIATKYRAPYGGYIDLFTGSDKWRRVLGGVLAGHSYWSDGYDAMVRDRKRLAETLARHPGWSYWQTEFCILRGPRGESGWGRDLGMRTALWVARILHLDLAVAEAGAWNWWLGLSVHDFKDGLVYVDGRKPPADASAVRPSKLLWVLGQYARFVRPGMVRVETSGLDLHLDGLLASAYVDPKTRACVVVLTNMGGKEEALDIRLPVARAWRAWRTSASEDLAALAAVPKRTPVRVPARSVVTLVSTPARSAPPR